MNVADYTYLINKPDNITEKQAEALGSVLNEFPYFQSARALRLKGLHKQNSFKYNYALKVTAAHTTDRSILFDFVTSETYDSIQGQYYDRKLRDLLNITVFDSEIVSAEAKKKIAEIRIDPIEKSILDSIKEATAVNFEETVKTEEKLSAFVEKSVSDSIPEETTIAFEEPIIIEENSVEVIENSTLDSATETTAVTLEEPVEVEEKPTETVTEQPIVVSSEEIPVKREHTPTFFEEIVDDEFPEVRIDPIEKSIFNSIKEAETVVFEEVKEIEVPENIITASEPEITEEPKEIEIPETVIVTEEQAVPEIEVTETVKAAEENLEIGKPLDFTFNEKHSFQEWLQLARTEPIDRTIEAPKQEELTKNAIEKAEKTMGSSTKMEKIEEEKKKKAEIIDRFIETNPKISPIKQTAITATVQLEINKDENTYLMTETLARVYLEQKKYTKAIQAYEILILKYPEKITFFADRISDIKILQQNNNNNN